MTIPPKVLLHPKNASRLQGPERPYVNANVTNFISWSRLVEELRASHEIRPREEVEAFVLTDDGIQYYVKTRD